MGYYGFFTIESIPSINDCIVGLSMKKLNQNVNIWLKILEKICQINY